MASPQCLLDGSTGTHRLALCELGYVAYVGADQLRQPRQEALDRRRLRCRRQTLKLSLGGLQSLAEGWRDHPVAYGCDQVIDLRPQLRNSLGAVVFPPRPQGFPHAQFDFGDNARLEQACLDICKQRGRELVPTNIASVRADSAIYVPGALEQLERLVRIATARVTAAGR